MTATHRPIVWHLALTQVLRRRSFFTGELFVFGPQGMGGRAVDPRAPVSSAAELAVELIEHCPWYLEPHEVHTHDIELARILAVRLRAYQIRVLELAPSKAFCDALQEYRRSQNAIAMWEFEFLKAA